MSVNYYRNIELNIVYEWAIHKYTDVHILDLHQLDKS